MTPRLWIAFGFTAALVIFLMITYFVRDTSSHGQYNTLRFLTSLCAGFAGGFFTGEALFELEGEIASGTRIAISGAAGCALFFAIWFTYGTRSEKLVDRIRLSIPAGLSFEEVARGIVEAVGGSISFEGIEEHQLEARLPAFEIDAPTPRAALLTLRYQSTELPSYKVEIEDGVFHIRP